MSAMKHGTNAGYKRGCRCEACCRASYEYIRRRKGAPKRPRSTGQRCDNVAIDAGALLRLFDRDGRPRAVLERDAGLSKSATYRVLERRRCTAATFDALCSALDINGYEIVDNNPERTRF